MIKNDLKSLLATMSTGEIYQLLADLKKYASTSTTVDSLKRVFESGHLLEFQLENGDTILVDEFVDADLVDNGEIHAIFNIFGVPDELQFGIHMNVADEWTLSKASPVREFTEVAPIFLTSGNETTPLASGAVSVAACKFQRGVYEEDIPEVFENCEKSVEEVKTEPVDKTAPSDKTPDKTPDKTDNLIDIFNAIGRWLKTENRRIILDISRTFSFEDQYGSSSTHNNFSLAYKHLTVDPDARTVKFGDCPSGKSDYTLKVDEFINGSVYLNANRDCLVIISEDRNYIVYISFMDGAKVIGLNNKSLDEFTRLVK